jgi:hypothetical protein
VVSSWRSRGSEVKVGWFDGIRCGTVEVGPNYHSLDVIFLLAHSHSSLLVFAINRTIGLLWEVSLSPQLLDLGLHFAKMCCVLHILEKRGEK